jgi:hypothetical protein
VGPGRAKIIEGDLESAGDEILIVTSGKTSSWTEGDGVSALSSPNGEEREEGGESSGVPALRDGDSGMSTTMGADPGAVIGSTEVQRESLEMVETGAVGDLVITEGETVESEMEVSSEIVALGTDDMRSDMDVIDSER